MNEISDTKQDTIHLPWLNHTVIGAGLTSALGDFCYETTTVLLPGFLAVLGVPAAALGVIEGLADMVASFTKMASGFIADKLGHRKQLVLIGYSLTPLGQALIGAAVGLPLILLGRIVSWFGKGLRGPLRDAIVVQAVDPKTRGRAFGFHRAMDTIGAVVGPSLGIVLLEWAQSWLQGSTDEPFRLVFWLSLIPGILAVLTFLTLVKDPQHSPNPSLQLITTLRTLPTRFKRYLLAIGLFGSGDFSHSLLILAATERLTPSLGLIRAAQVAGMLYVGRNLVQTLASYPVGALADRFGAIAMLFIGYLLGALTALLTAVAFVFNITNIAFFSVIFLIAGLYVAVQDSLESTVTADIVATDTLATSYGVLGLVNGVTKFISSAFVGFVWTTVSPVVGFGMAATFMLTGSIALKRVNAAPRSTTV